MAKGKSFIDWCLDAMEDEEMLRYFVNAADSTDLKNYFHTKGYTDITQNDCTKLIKAKDIGFRSYFEAQAIGPVPGRGY